MKIDVHQHLWTAPLVRALADRRELPFVREENGLMVLFLPHERPYVIAPAAGALDVRAMQLERDGVEVAFVCLSSPLGIESLPREESRPVLEAYHAGALALGPSFQAWGAIALDEPDPDDVDRLIDRGCVGLSLPAGALAGSEQLAGLGAVLERLELRDAPLFVHPGPGCDHGRHSPLHASLGEPLWWPAMTTYVAQLQAAWFAFLHAGRTQHPNLRVIFAALAGLAPLHAERLGSRGGPVSRIADDGIFYETSSYGPHTAGVLARLVGRDQLLYGSDRPEVDPAGQNLLPGAHDWELIELSTRRAIEGDGVGTRRLLSRTV